MQFILKNLTNHHLLIMDKFSWSTCSLKHHVITEFSRCPVLHRKCQTLNKHKMQMCEHGFPWNAYSLGMTNPWLIFSSQSYGKVPKEGQGPQMTGIWYLKHVWSLRNASAYTAISPRHHQPWQLPELQKTWKDAKPPSGESVTTFFDFTFLTIRQQMSGMVWIPQRKHKMAEKLNF